MSTVVQNRSLSLAGPYLRGMQKRGELVPGAAEKISERFERHGGGPEQVLRDVITYLDGTPSLPAQLAMAGLPAYPARPAEPGQGAHFLNPEHEPAREMPVRSILSRLAEGGHINRDAVAPLVETMAADTAGLPLGTIAERVAQKLGKRENWSFLTEAPPKPAAELKVLAALKIFRTEGYLDYRADLDAVAEKWASETGHRPEHEVAKLVAQRLGMAHHADGLTRDGQPVQILGSHPIFRRPPPLTAEQRQQAGLPNLAPF